MHHVRQALCNENRQKEMIKNYLKLYLVLETSMLKVPLDEFIPAVIAGGVTAIQLRDKGMTAAEQYATGLRVTELIGEKDVLFVVNDRIDTAVALGAKAVHLGIKDIPLAVAKQCFPDMIYGYSCNDVTDAETAHDADYIGVGPAFFTGTKKDLRPVIDIMKIAEIVDRAQRPAVAIGGINSDNVHELRGTGIAGVAVSSCICASDEPMVAASDLRLKIEKL